MEYFTFSEDAKYELVTPTYAVLKFGHAEIWAGGRADIRAGGYADIWSGGYADIEAGGRAVVLAGGHADIRDGGRADKLEEMQILAESDGYNLSRTSDGRYYAGCRIALTAAEALAHWDREDREDDRACLFTLAIGLAENCK